MFFRPSNFLKKLTCLCLILCLTERVAISQTPRWYEFSPDNKECIVKNSNLPTPWLNRLSNDVFFTWVTQNGYVESYLLDPGSNGLTNPQNTSGRIFIRDKDNGNYFQINKPSEKSSWECAVGLGYNRISNSINGLNTKATYFVPRADNLLVILVEVSNATGQDKTLDLFAQVEWNLGDPVKSIIYKGDGRGGSQFNLYKRAFMHDNAIIARQENWRNTGTCIPWPYTGFFSVNEPVSAYETIKGNFLGIEEDYDHPEAVRNGTCTKTDFCSQAQYPWGVLQNTVHLKNGETKTLVYTLGMSREEKGVAAIVKKYNDVGFAKKSFDELTTYYDQFVSASVNIETPDKENDRIINIWTKYLWRQFWKKSLNNQAYGLGLWSYGLEGESIGAAPEQFLLPFDTTILRNCILNELRHQVSDTSQTDLFGPGETTMLYQDLGLTGPPTTHKGKFAVPHHHSIYGLFSIYYYLLESGDLDLLSTEIPYMDGKTGTVWEHIQTGLYIAVKGIDDRGFPQIPANVGDWMDEFTKISRDGKAESEMLGAEIGFLLKGFAEIAQKTNRTAEHDRWMSIYNRLREAVNTFGWDGEWYITAFSDRGNPFIPVGSKTNKEGKIYLNAQAWPILSGMATPEQASKSLISIKKFLMSDYGPMVFSPSYTEYVENIGTQSIYAPGFRNACIYLRPAGWAIAAACLGNQPELANEMYNAAALKTRAKDIEHFEAEPYVYPENYNGPDHRLKGRGEFQWNLGEGGGWMWTSYVNYILGVRPDLDGLLIDPRIPANWPGYKVTRPFRGSLYHIEVKNPGRVSSGISWIKLDGKKIKGNIIPSYRDGKDHKVEVVMRASKK